jgi:hypothetical protein
MKHPRDDPMLIDEFLPAWDVVERHNIRIQAGTDVVYRCLEEADLGAPRVIRFLLRMRGMPTGAGVGAGRRGSLNLRELERIGFMRLAEEHGRELVVGVIGRFWKLDGDLRRVAPQNFRGFTRPGFAKATWNFHVAPHSSGATELATETRVLCLDRSSRRFFRVYWFFVRPFSGLIRRRILGLIKREAERRSPGAFLERSTNSQLLGR